MLTDAALKALRPKEKSYKVTDRDGMYVVVSPAGTLSFRLDYRLHGRRETVVLGKYGPTGLSLARAREKCIDAKRAVGEGRSPAIEKQREKRRLLEARSFGELGEKWLVAAPMADSTRAMRRSIFERELLPVWRKRLLNEIAPGDLRAHCAAIVDRGAPATAIHVRDIVKQIYGFAILHGEKIANPADEVGPASIASFVPRDRSLSPAEIRIMLKQLDHVATLPTIRLGLRLYLLTMVRKSELLDATWDEVDFENAVWTIPKERMKRSKAHNVYFSRQVLDIFIALDEHAKSLDESLLWPLWDRVADATLRDTEARQAMNDIFTDALNSSAGRLTEILIRKMPATIGDDAVPAEVKARLDRIAAVRSHAGRLARVRLAAEVSMLFQRAPAWTAEHIVPLFEWSSPEAVDAWSARKYSNYIGSPKLFALTKNAFLGLFSRPATPDEDLRVFSEWLTAILIANQSKQAGYPILPTEARVALRRAGVRALSSVGHRLTAELAGGTSAERGARWRSVVGPVFISMWPLDVELQTSSTTYKLAQLVRNTGDAFSEAADVIIPFIRPDEGRSHSTVYAIAEADDTIYRLAPAKVLDLLTAVVGDASSGNIYGLSKAIDRILAFDPKLGDTRKFQRLLSVAS